MQTLEGDDPPELMAQQSKLDIGVTSGKPVKVSWRGEGLMRACQAQDLTTMGYIYIITSDSSDRSQS